MDPVAVDVERRLWTSAFSLVCAIVGSSAGLYCLFRLPLMLQLFHPGSFLLALLFCVIFFAWPVVVVELAIGQKFRLSAVPALDKLTRGGRGIAFASVLIGSLLTAAYSSSSLALVVSPGFDELVNKYTSSTSSSPSSSSEQKDSMIGKDNITQANASDKNITANFPSSDIIMGGGGGGDWGSLLALFAFWFIAAYLSWKFTNQTSLFSHILTPLPLLLWSILAIFASSVVENSALFRDLLSPNTVSLSDGRLWANAAGQALLLLQVGTGVTITFGSKSKNVHSVVNVSVAIIAVAMLFAFFVTVTSAGSIAIINNNANNATADNSLVSDYSSLLTTTMEPQKNVVGEMLVTSTTTTTSPATTTPAPSPSSSSKSSSLSPMTTTYFSAVTILPALFVQAGQGSTTFGVIVYIVAIVVGVLSMSLLLGSFYNSMADLHVALRSPMTTFIAAGVCFGIGAPFAFLSSNSSSSSSSSSSSALVLLALDQAVVGACLPLLVLAESLIVAFGGWGGPSAWFLLKQMNEEDLSWRGKLSAGYAILRDFGGSTRYRNLLQTEESQKQVQLNNALRDAKRYSSSNTNTNNTFTTSQKSSSFSSPSSNVNNNNADSFVIQEDLTGWERNFIVTGFGRLTIILLPFFLKLFIPVCACLVVIGTIVNFASDSNKNTAGETVFTLVVIGTLLSVYIVALKSAASDENDHDDVDNVHNDDDDNGTNKNNITAADVARRRRTPWILDETITRHRNTNDDEIAMKERSDNTNNPISVEFDQQHNDDDEFSNIAPPPPMTILSLPSASPDGGSGNNTPKPTSTSSRRNVRELSTSSLNEDQMENFLMFQQQQRVVASEESKMQVMAKVVSPSGSRHRQYHQTNNTNNNSGSGSGLAQFSPISNDENQKPQTQHQQQQQDEDDAEKDKNRLLSPSPKIPMMHNNITQNQQQLPTATAVNTNANNNNSNNSTIVALSHNNSGLYSPRGSGGGDGGGGAGAGGCSNVTSTSSNNANNNNNNNNNPNIQHHHQTQLSGNFFFGSSQNSANNVFGNQNSNEGSVKENNNNIYDHTPTPTSSPRNHSHNNNNNMHPSRHQTQQFLDDDGENLFGNNNNQNENE